VGTKPGGDDSPCYNNADDYWRSRPYYVTSHFKFSFLTSSYINIIANTMTTSVTRSYFADGKVRFTCRKRNSTSLSFRHTGRPVCQKQLFHDTSWRWLIPSNFVSKNIGKNERIWWKM
jgi:hypothetical protein